MSPYSFAWVCWVLVGCIIETAAYIHGGYRATLTGHLTHFMLSSPWVMVLVPTFFVGVAIHLLTDVVRLRP